jgi:hypothetical protein
MKKLVLLALMALAFVASTNTGRAVGPIPTCNPCPNVR